MNLRLIRATLATERIGQALLFLPATTSTMDVARRHAERGAAEGLVALADEQTAGRGRLGRQWVAPAGVNLLGTLLLRPTREQAALLSMVAPLAVAEAAASVGVEARFKWPNDVLVGGRKLAGILIEGAFQGDSPSYALVGIGLNVNLETAAEPSIAAIATSLRDITGTACSREAVLATLLTACERHYMATSAADLRALWRDRLDTLGQAVQATFAGRTEEGVAEDVDREGGLILRRPDGSRVMISAGDVTLRPPAQP